MVNYFLDKFVSTDLVPSDFWMKIMGNYAIKSLVNDEPYFIEFDVEKET